MGWTMVSLRLLNSASSKRAKPLDYAAYGNHYCECRIHHVRHNSASGIISAPLAAATLPHQSGETSEGYLELR
jgi:hypothetical protein